MKSAVVTGAASGIGRATAVHLARDGYGVALVDIDLSGMNETLHSIESESGGPAAPARRRTPRADGRGPRETGGVMRPASSRTI
jgi:NAD(P)-dependent dehydrogenase (short-subunit alcohol dehydrogenase family)